MRLIILNICFFLSFVAKSQNLVPNSSFEIYTTCPTNFSQLNNAIPWISTISTPDYFNACSTSTDVAVPKNFFGTNYQQPKSGNAYAGIITLGPIGSNTRENLSVQLTTLLINGNNYLIKFYVVNMQSYDVANNNIALNFSTNLTYTVASGSSVNLPMHIYKFGNPVIKDTLNWTEIMGIYKANGTEQYITIGNFKDDTNTKIDTTNYGMIGYAGYYMVDDVSVEQICTPFWSYRDTTVTIGDSVLIGPAITGLNINWYDATGTFITNAPGIYVKPNSPTFYTASEDFCNGITSHTINVMVTPTSVKEYDKLQNSIKIFPNPSNGNFNLQFDDLKSGDIEINISDIAGKIIHKNKLQLASNKINLDVNLENGAYFMEIKNSKSNATVVKKIIIQK